MSATVTWATTRDQRVTPCYYFSSERRHSDSGLSSDVSDDDSRVITISDNDSDGQIYENISFHQQRVSSSQDSIVSNVTSFPAPPLNFRDNPNIDQSSQEKDQIVLNNDSEGFHDWHQDDDDQTNKTNKESSLDFDFSVKTLRRKKVNCKVFCSYLNLSILNALCIVGFSTQFCGSLPAGTNDFKQGNWNNSWH